VNAAFFWPDIQELLRLLSAHVVGYVIVGGRRLRVHFIGLEALLQSPYSQCG